MPEGCAKFHARNPFLAGGQLDGRSDSIDILNTEIRINLINSPQIQANCTVSLKAKLPGINSVRFDLEGLQVDSVRQTFAMPLVYTYDGRFLEVQYLQPLEVDSLMQCQVFYHGSPVQDASAWGGFYHVGAYTFNLGVGFAADPHSYGRIWFPCFDNFVERSSFKVVITSPSGQPGYSNGVLKLAQPFPNGITRTWQMDEAIPSYLACFAAGPYVSFKRSYPGENGMIPVEIAANAADTTKVAGTFSNLPQAISCFEYWYGPFRWPKIGYSLVPFDMGAMEHATNIAIGSAYINGSKTYETLWAHELSHHWWGDLATCSTAEDMWLNEGWASYSEHLFTEKVYGPAAYRDAVRANHLDVLQKAHLKENGYLAVSGVPHDLTYGEHVYHKGASVAHNLRGYLGDSLFRVGCRSVLNQTSFDNWSSAEFRDKLEAATGQNLHDFFEDWVFSGGYPDFSIDSLKYFFSPIDGPTVVRLFVKQKLRGAPHFHHNVPLEFSFVMNNGQRVYRQGLVSGENTVLDFEFSPFGPIPEAVFVNTNEHLKLLQARSEGEKTFKSTGGNNFSEAKFNLTVNTLGADSVLVRVEHHFVAPDNAGANPKGYVLSERYWSLQTLPQALPPSFDAQAVLIYDARPSGNYLDQAVFDGPGVTEDSVILVYRKGPGYPWQEWPSYTKLTLGSSTDTYGQIRPMHLKPGEYTIARGQSTSRAQEPNPLGKVRISPNPSSGDISIDTEQFFDSVTLVSSDGQVEKTWRFNAGNHQMLHLDALPSGNYWLLINGEKGNAVKSFHRL